MKERCLSSVGQSVETSAGGGNGRCAILKSSLKAMHIFYCYATSLLIKLPAAELGSYRLGQWSVVSHNEKVIKTINMEGNLANVEMREGDVAGPARAPTNYQLDQSSFEIESDDGRAGPG